ncbi:MAG: TerC family protein [Paludibacteraceae bacterium]|nr:TerC family protein [Paludibacteraceae bacterium]
MSVYDIVSFVGFLALIVSLLALDLCVFHKEDRVISFKESLRWTLFWIAVSCVFGGVIYFFGEYIHGVNSMESLAEVNARHGHGMTIDPLLGLEENIQNYRQVLTLEYFTGYLIEKSLSLDNIFVMIMIFMGFGIDQKYYHRVLFWGILGAIILRFIFIFLSAALIQRFAWILAIFGVVLVVSGIKMIFAKEEEEQIDTENHPVVKFFSKHFRLLREYKGHSFFVRHEGKIYATSLFLVLLVIEFSDIIFAVDSIPAIFSVTQDPYIVFFSNIFAILGLRSLFFMLSSIMNLFRYLKTGVSFLLIFIGVKMLLHTFLHIEIGTGISLCVILGILTVSILASILITKKENA